MRAARAHGATRPEGVAVEAGEASTTLAGDEVDATSSSTDTSDTGDQEDDEEGTTTESSDHDGTLLGPVGEVIVTGGHVVEDTGAVETEDTEIEVTGGVTVEDGTVAVSLIIVDIGIISSGATTFRGLTDEGGEVGGIGGIEEGLGVKSLGVVGGEVIVDELNDVGSIPTVFTVTGVTSGVVVGPGPLEVNVVTDGDAETLRGEVILHAVTDLGDVTTLTTDGQIVDVGGHETEGCGLDGEDVRAILESTTELVGVDVETEGHLTEGDEGIVLDGRALTVGSSIDVPGIVVTGGDVVTDTEEARGLINVGDGDVDVVHVTVLAGTEMVVTRPLSLLAAGSGDTVSGGGFPSGTSSLAGGLVVVGGVITEVATQNVLGLTEVPVAARGVGGEDSKITEGSRVPVRVVVTLLIALKTGLAATVVLAGSTSTGTVVDVLGSGEETLVTLTSAAALVEVNRLMVADISVLVVIDGDLIGAGVSTSGTGRILAGAILELRRAGVLPDHITAGLAVGTARVLVGPLQLEDGATIVVDGGGDSIATSGVVLGVEQPVGSLTIVVLLVTAVVGATGRVHVHIGGNGQGQGQEDGEGEDSLHVG